MPSTICNEDQVIYSSGRSPRYDLLKTKKNPSSYVCTKDEVSSNNTNLAYLETEQFIQVNEIKRLTHNHGSASDLR
jgi:hypothetical protein